jgi:hypothetical protein
MKANESNERRHLLRLLLSELAQYHRVSDILTKDPTPEEKSSDQTEQQKVIEVNDLALKLLDVLVSYAMNEVRIHINQFKGLTRFNHIFCSNQIVDNEIVSFTTNKLYIYFIFIVQSPFQTHTNSAFLVGSTT